MDLTALPAQVLATAVRWLDAQIIHGPVLVHCALGLSRSASVIATWMAWRKRAADTAAAFAQLNALRPGITWSDEHLVQSTLALKILGDDADQR